MGLWELDLLEEAGVEGSPARDVAPAGLGRNVDADDLGRVPRLLHRVQEVPVGAADVDHPLEASTRVERIDAAQETPVRTQ